MTRCVATKKNGLCCKNKAIEGKVVCHAHLSDVEMVDELPKEETKKRRVASTNVDLDVLVDRISALEIQVSALSNKKVSKKRNLTDAGIRRKASFIFYNAHKEQENILNVVRSRLQAAGLYRTKIVNGVQKESIHWMIVKDHTDEIFAALPDVEKSKWYNMAAFDNK